MNIRSAVYDFCDVLKTVKTVSNEKIYASWIFRVFENLSVIFQQVLRIITSN